MARQGDGQRGGGDTLSGRPHHTPIIIVAEAHENATAVTDTVARVLHGIKELPLPPRNQPRSVIEARTPPKAPRRCTRHNPPVKIKFNQAPHNSERTYQIASGSRYDPPSNEQIKSPSIAPQETPQHISFASSAVNKTVLEMDGTRIFHTTTPASTLYQLSHPITWDADEKLDGLTLTAMRELPYIPPKVGPRRVCDIEFIDKVFDDDDPYPQALIRSPSWGLKSPLLKFYYESKGRVMGVCDIQGSCATKNRWNRYQPSLVLAAGIVEKGVYTEKSKLDYPNGVYQVQWLSCKNEHIIALEICDLVQGDNGRLKRRYRLSFNRTRLLDQDDTDLLVASWCTRVWMEEVFMKAMKISYKNVIEKKTRKGFRYRSKKMGRKIGRAPRRICGYKPQKRDTHHCYYDRKNRSSSTR